MSWIDRILPSISRSRDRDDKGSGKIPEGLWRQCPRCEATLFHETLEKNADVCPKCDYHIRISARRRIEIFLDPKDQRELDSDLEPLDSLNFKDLKRYKDRIQAAKKTTGENDALVVGGSMGAVVGEKFVRAVNACISDRLPLICFSTSGGARMQEALISLMQMAKTAAALEELNRQALPYISVLVDPVYGGVSASLAMLGDINIAEPNALVGFTGPDVIKQTVRVNLPEGFQRSEFLLEHGAIDMIVDRREMRNKISSILEKLNYRNS